MSLSEHVESHLGLIEKGWKDETSSHNFRIVSFRHQPVKEARTYLSLGMSDHALKMGDSRTVRQEFLFSEKDNFDPEKTVSFLMSLCESIIERRSGVLRGEVISLHSELSEKVGFDGVYCSIPILFEDDFRSYDRDALPVVIVWAVPIFQDEINFIHVNGWEPFEDLLERINPDLLSLNRKPVIS